MRIGVTYENGQIFQHFGKTEQFKVYDIQDGTIVQTEIVDTNGSGHGALAGFLRENQVDTLICGESEAVRRVLFQKQESSCTAAYQEMQMRQ